MFPDRSNEIAIHRDNAHKAIQTKNYDAARVFFLKWVESLRQQNKNTGGDMQSELAAAQKEYSEFVKTDPLYLRLCTAILPAIQNSPGILQTELYKRLPQIEKSDLSYALYFAAEHGKIKREKKGRTYALSVS